MAKPKKKIGRKNVYDSVILKRTEDIKRLLKEGYYEKDIAKSIGIGEATWYKYKAEKEEFRKLIEEGQRSNIDELITSAKRLAVGYEYEEEKIIIQLDADGQPVRRLRETYKKHQPPNANILMYLINNWSKGEYTKDPLAMKFREEELKLKKDLANREDW